MKWKQNGKNSTLDTFIGANTVLEGYIYTERSISVEGNVRGSIETKGEVVVGRQGKIEADITAETVVVGGNVVGNVTAHRRLEITATGRVTGDIEAGKITVEEGGAVNGLCKMRGEAGEQQAQAKELQSLELVS